MKSLQHCESTTKQYDNWRTFRDEIKVSTMLESLVPSTLSKKNCDDRKRNLKR